MLALHILAGAIALTAGYLALYSGKGRWLHRRAGRVFAVAMFAMTGLGALMSFGGGINRVNIIAATLTAYFVATGLLAVTRSVVESPGLHKSLAVAATLIAGAAWVLGMMATRLPNNVLDHVPAAAIFMFAVIGTLGALGDWRLLRAGYIEGKRRIARHLWRMGYALWVATTSFFFGQARHLPDWLRESRLNLWIVLLVSLTVLFWFLRTRFRRQRNAIPAQHAGVTESRAYGIE